MLWPFPAPPPPLTARESLAFPGGPLPMLPCPRGHPLPLLVAGMAMLHQGVVEWRLGRRREVGGSARGCRRVDSGVVTARPTITFPAAAEPSCLSRPATPSPCSLRGRLLPRCRSHHAASVRPFHTLFPPCSRVCAPPPPWHWGLSSPVMSTPSHPPPVTGPCGSSWRYWRRWRSAWRRWCYQRALSRLGFASCRRVRWPGVEGCACETLGRRRRHRWPTRPQPTRRRQRWPPQRR